MTSGPEEDTTYSTVSSSTAKTVHRPVVIKDEWSPSLNGEGDSNGDSFLDIIEGRRAVPAVVRKR